MSLYLLAFLAQLDARPDEASVERGPAGLSLEWKDTEERLRGTLHPAAPVVGEPIEVVLHVGSFDGPEFNGPLRVSLRPLNATMGETVTVTRSSSEVSWQTRLVAPSAGPYTLEVGFRTTHNKLVHAAIDVREAPLSRWPWLVVVGVVSALALGLGVRSVLRKG